MVLHLRVVALLLGQALLLGSGGPVAYASVVWVVAATGVRFGEEYVACVRTYDAGYSRRPRGSGQAPRFRTATARRRAASDQKRGI